MVALPFFVAERAPDWPEIPASISGLDLATTRTEIFRVLTTSALYRLADIFDLLEKSVGRIARIIVSGGMTRSADALAILADVLGRDLEVARETEASLRGAALHALRSNGSTSREAKRGRIIRCEKKLAKKHRARREKQRYLVEQASSILAE